MPSSHPSGLAAGDRVLFRAVRGDIERTGVLVDDPSGNWVRVQYDDQPDADSALVETLTRVES